MKSNPNQKLEIRINKEYQSLIRPLTKQEFKNLKQSIEGQGFWESNPLILNKKGEILDGYHRYRICKELGIKPEAIIASFDDELQEKLYVRDSNFRRRQLSLFERIEAEISFKPTYQEIAKRNESLGGKSKGKGVRFLTPLGRVDQMIGQLAGVSYDTVRKVEKILENAPQDLLDRLRSNKESINSVYNEVIKEQKRQEIITNAASIAITSRANSNDRLKLINNDFRKVEEIKDNSVDLIFTDPPYAEQDLPIYSDLAKFAYRILVEGGSIVTYLRQSDIPTIIRYMEDAGLTYYWFLVITLAGRFPRAHDKGIVIKQKPLLWFTNGKRKRLDNYMSDLILSKSPSGRKELHKWAQSPTEAQKIISGLTLENQSVLDPMMGSGTTGYAALNLKRKFIGIEIDPKKFTIAKAQLANWLTN